MTADLDFPSTQGKTMHKHLHGLIVSPRSVKKQYRCSSTHMSNINIQKDTPEPPFGTFTLFSQPTSPNQRHSPAATSSSNKPGASSRLKQQERRKQLFCFFFPEAREDEALNSWLAPSEQCKAFSLFKLKIKLIFSHAFIGGIQDRKDTLLTARSALRMRQESGKKNLSLEKLLKILKYFPFQTRIL